jgi:hypothetical protein
MATFTVGVPFGKLEVEIRVTVAMCATVVWVQETKTGVRSIPV